MHTSPAEDAYLRAHVWGLLATGRRDGSPQLSMVAYDWNGIDLVISCRSSAAKYVNAKRHDSVVFAVPDDVDNLTVTGAAICHATGAERDALTTRLRDRLADGHEWASTMLSRDIDAGLDAVDRVIIQVVPTSIQLLQPQN